MKGLTATGLKKDQFFVGNISSEYESGNTTVNVKVDTYSNVSTKATISDVLPSMKATFSFYIPDHKSGKLDVHYLHHHAAINSSIGLNPAPLLELAAVIGDKGLALGGEVGFDTAIFFFHEVQCWDKLQQARFYYSINTHKVYTPNLDFLEENDDKVDLT